MCGTSNFVADRIRRGFSSKLFLGWFGPRGLASIVFAIIVLDENLPGGETISVIVTCTVGLSLLAHGISANPMARWIAEKEREVDRT